MNSIWNNRMIWLRRLRRRTPNLNSKKSRRRPFNSKLNKWRTCWSSRRRTSSMRSRASASSSNWKKWRTAKQWCSSTNTISSRLSSSNGSETFWAFRIRLLNRMPINRTFSTKEKGQRSYSQLRTSFLLIKEKTTARGWGAKASWDTARCKRRDTNFRRTTVRNQAEPWHSCSVAKFTIPSNSDKTSTEALRTQMIRKRKVVIIPRISAVASSLITFNERMRGPLIIFRISKITHSKTNSKRTPPSRIKAISISSSRRKNLNESFLSL